MATMSYVTGTGQDPRLAAITPEGPALARHRVTLGGAEVAVRFNAPVGSTSRFGPWPADMPVGTGNSVTGRDQGFLVRQAGGVRDEQDRYLWRYDCYI